jgi:ADP-ribosyl-[dinitrogen reductase] hydrolase
VPTILTSMKISTTQRDRALGAIVASAAGDALGAPYEFNPPIPASEPVELKAGGGWELGEFTDDTAMAIVILQALDNGLDLASQEAQDFIVREWSEWSQSAPDVGIQTRKILWHLSEQTAAEARAKAEALHLSTGRTAGNGSLMRTGPVALGSLGSAEITAQNARLLSELTHWDQTAGDACVLWSLAIRHAILECALDVRVGLSAIPEERREFWANLITEAEENEPAYFANNGWVIHAFQAAWSAIHLAVTAPASQFKHEAERLSFGLEHAVRAGYDTDTVAAIAGSLLGARFGLTAVPSTWRLKLHGWPGITELELTRMANRVLNRAEGLSGWPAVEFMDYKTWSAKHELVQHPLDSGVWLGGVGALKTLPAEVTAVVSLCRLGTDDVPASIETKLEVMLLDKVGSENNQNLPHLFSDIAAAVKELRNEGHTVFVHCVQSQSRTPSVAAAYSMKYFGRSASQALEEISGVLAGANPNSYFVETLNELSLE